MFKRIFTHAGCFHADDVVSVLLMEALAPAAEVLRVAELPKDFNRLGKDCALDIGGRVASSEHIWDHHQVDRDVRSDGLPYATAGLLWREFGVRILEKLSVPRELRAEVKMNLDRRVFRAIDAADNGVGETPSDCLTFSSAIAAMNSSPKEDNRGAFFQAVMVARNVFAGMVAQAERAAEARQKVLKAKTAHNGRVLMLTEILPWKENLPHRGDYGNLLYVIQPSARGGYTAQQVPVEPGSFEGRKPFPESWAGLREKDLAEKIGRLDEPTSSSLFCHPGRFIAGAGNSQDVKVLVREALKD